MLSAGIAETHLPKTAFRLRSLTSLRSPSAISSAGEGISRCGSHSRTPLLIFYGNYRRMYLLRGDSFLAPSSHLSLVAGATFLPDGVTCMHLWPQWCPQPDQSGAFPGIQESRPGLRPGLQHSARDHILGSRGWDAPPWKDHINSGKLLVKARKKYH